MSSSLVYLHIPKSAGTSHRAYLSKVFGEDQVFWYGLQSDATKFNATDVGSSCAVGGHKPLAFYPRSFNALYSSVVRDPVERAVSFFNFCTEEPEARNKAWLEQREKALKEWRKLGIDRSSLSRSIENCDAFRQDISNLQCSYLSRYEPTFEGVLKTLKEENMVIGVFDNLPRFNKFLQAELNFPIENEARANVGRDGYSSNIFSEPGIVDLIRSINAEDQRLYDFLRLEQGGLYVGANNIGSVRSNVPTIENSNNLDNTRYPFNWGEVQLFGKGIVKPDSNGTLLVNLAISNATDQRLRFSKHKDESRSIGWQVLNKNGVQIGNFRGTVKIGQIIPAENLRVTDVSLKLDDEILQNEEADIIEYSIVDGSEWLNQKYPLNSAWLKLVGRA